MTAMIETNFKEITKGMIKKHSAIVSMLNPALLEKRKKYMILCLRTDGLLNIVSCLAALLGLCVCCAGMM